jgi:probable rRNA maturation factor
MNNMKTNIVNYFNQQSYQDLVDRVSTAASNQLALDPLATLTVILVDDAYIRTLNNTYRNKDSATDVLTFPDGELHHLGDVFVSMETCQQQATDYGHSMERELGFLIVHGLLHTLGYDHHTKEEEDIMFPLQHKILQKAKLTR